MIVGTVVGVAQTNVKRMLAYSSIAHAGYLLVGIIAANSVGKAAVLFYLLAYAVTNLGAFAVMALLASKPNEHDEVRDFAGLWESRPGMAALMTVFLLSLGGFPPTAGFIAQVVHLRRRGPGRALRARHHRRALERHLGLLLPAHHRDDVHVRPRPRGAGGPRLADGRRRRSPSRSPRSSTSASIPTGIIELALEFDRHNLLEASRLRWRRDGLGGRSALAAPVPSSPRSPSEPVSPVSVCASARPPDSLTI